jgi:hypothetical protein
VSPSPSTEILRTGDPKIATTALATGAPLGEVEQDGGRLVFVFPGLTTHFLTRIANDEIQVSALAMITAWERIIGMIAAAQRERRAEWRR